MEAKLVGRQADGDAVAEGDGHHLFQPLPVDEGAEGRLRVGQVDDPLVIDGDVGVVLRHLREQELDVDVRRAADADALGEGAAPTLLETDHVVGHRHPLGARRLHLGARHELVPGLTERGVERARVLRERVEAAGLLNRLRRGVAAADEHRHRPIAVVRCRIPTILFGEIHQAREGAITHAGPRQCSTRQTIRVSG